MQIGEYILGKDLMQGFMSFQNITEKQVFKVLLPKTSKMVNSINEIKEPNDTPFIFVNVNDTTDSDYPHHLERGHPGIQWL